MIYSAGFALTFNRFVGLGEDPQVLAVRAPALFTVSGHNLGHIKLANRIVLVDCRYIPSCDKRSSP